MAYVTRAQVEAKIPAQLLLEALEDDGDGLEDAGLFDELVDLASQEADGLVSTIYPVPFADPAPAAIRTAAFVFTCEAVYQRRGIDADSNPWTKQANWWRNRLGKVGEGEMPIDAAEEQSSGAEYGGPARIPGRHDMSTPT